MVKSRISISFFIVFIFIFGSFTNVLAAKSDIDGHWASTQIEKWVGQGLVNGYSDGTFMPDMTISRAEFFALVNRVFNNKNKATISFKDVESSDWYFEDIQKAVNAKYINGYTDGTVKPNNPITRQEASKILVIAFSLENKSSTYKLNFKDAAAIDDWAVNYVGRLTEMQVIKGYEDGTFAPNSYVTRAEAVTMLDRLCGEILNKENINVEGKKINSSLLINKPNISLKDVIIEGNIYITEGVETNELVFDNVTVKGNAFIKGAKLSKLSINGGGINEICIDTQGTIIEVNTKNLVADTITAKTSVKLNILGGSIVKTINSAAKSEVNISEKAGLNKLSISSNGKDSVIISKPGVTVDSQADSILINGKEFKKGSWLVEEYTFDIIDIY